MDLFDLNGNEAKAKPLAERMRANNLNDFIGQKHIVAEGSLLRRAISLDRLGSCIFWGPPGTGKTTLANIIAQTTHGEFIKLNAVQSGVADVKRAVEQARDALKMYGKRTYLMLDECHRFNKTQSDSLSVSYTHLRAHETKANLVCRLLLEKNFFNDTATTEIYTYAIVGSVRCV